jgi:hypothetical protein
MSLALLSPALPVSRTKSLRQARAAAAIRQVMRAALAGAKQVGRAVLVCGVFAVMLAVAMALGLLIWLPRFQITW